jgi:hypothetical protein
MQVNQFLVNYYFSGWSSVFSFYTKIISFYENLLLGQVTENKKIC